VLRCPISVSTLPVRGLLTPRKGKEVLRDIKTVLYVQIRSEEEQHKQRAETNRGTGLAIFFLISPTKPRGANSDVLMMLRIVAPRHTNL
jgi:hypothetical protein